MGGSKGQRVIIFKIEQIVLFCNSLLTVDKNVMQTKSTD